MHYHLELYFNHEPTRAEIDEAMAPFEEKDVPRYRMYTKAEALDAKRREIAHYMENLCYSRWIKDKESYEGENPHEGHINYLKEVEANHDDEEWLLSKVYTEWEDDVDEDGNIYSTYNPDGIWDWFQIGARWKGNHDPDYDANNDEEHKETCWLCGGSGKRTDMVVANGCNGCHGSGISQKWPTQWKPHDTDICPLEFARKDLTAAYLIVDGTLYATEVWNGFTFEDGGFDGKVFPKLLELGKEDGWLVTIDLHC